MRRGGRTNRVRMMSSGTNTTPATAAAATAIPKLVQGYGLSTTSTAIPPANPGSGAFSTADRNERVQFSIVRSKAE